jgi:hypothetical protein
MKALILFLLLLLTNGAMAQGAQYVRQNQINIERIISGRSYIQFSTNDSKHATTATRIDCGAISNHNKSSRRVETSSSLQSNKRASNRGKKGN